MRLSPDTIVCSPHLQLMPEEIPTTTRIQREHGLRPRCSTLRERMGAQQRLFVKPVKNRNMIMADVREQPFLIGFSSDEMYTANLFPDTARVLQTKVHLLSKVNIGPAH